MAYQLVDPCATGTLPGVWDTSGLHWYEGVNGVLCRSCDADGFLLSPTLPAFATYIVQFKFAFHGGPTHISRLVNAREGSTTHVDLRITTSRTLQFTRNGTNIGSAYTIPMDRAEHYYQVKITVDDSSGLAELKVDGVTELTFSGDTRNGGTGVIDNIAMAHGTSVSQANFVLYHLRNIQIISGTGDAPTDYTDERNVAYLEPTANGNENDFTASGAASNFEAVDDRTLPGSGHDGDTSYVVNGTVGNRDLYALRDVDSDATIEAFGVLTRGRYESSGPKYKPVVRHAGSNNLLTEVTLTSSYKTNLQMRRDNPGTSAQWTASDVNAVEVGEEITV